MIKMAIHLKTSDVKFVITKMTMILTDKLLLNKTFRSSYRRRHTEDTCEHAQDEVQGYRTAVSFCSLMKL